MLLVLTETRSKAEIAFAALHSRSCPLVPCKIVSMSACLDNSFHNFEDQFSILARSFPVSEARWVISSIYVLTFSSMIQDD